MQLDRIRTWSFAIVMCGVGAVAISCGLQPVQDETSNAHQYAVVTTASATSGESEQVMHHIVKQIFLKDRHFWPNGQAATPFAPPQDSEAWSFFRANVLDKSQVSMDEHWLSLKDRVGETPPEVVKSDKDTSNRVKRTPGAVGIVRKQSASTSDGDVVVLFTFPP